MTKQDRVRNKMLARLYADYFMPSRLDEYRSILQLSISNEYIVCSIGSFWNLIESGQLNGNSKYLILRHDVDTDPETARAMWKVERELQIRSTYYFRLSTLDVALIKELHEQGVEVGYHYEELATFAKLHGLRTRDEVMRAMGEIRNLFRENLRKVREKTSLPMENVASHGDFVNRKLQCSNWILLNDMDFRKEEGIKLEAYDEAFMRHVVSRHSDDAFPRLWKPESPQSAIERKLRVIYLLVHPRHWRSCRKANFSDDMNRLIEGIHYRWFA